MNINQKFLTTALLPPNRLVGNYPAIKSAILKILTCICSALTGFGLLFLLQVMIVGIADRLGISPKTSWLATSILYVASLIGSTFFIGSKTNHNQLKKYIPFVIVSNPEEPFCKILVIKKKGV